MLSSSLECLTTFIKQHPLGGCPIEQFPTILEVDSYVWNLLQEISEARWDCFKISSQTNAPTLVEAMRTVYGLNSIPIPSPDVEMVVDVPEVEEVAFTLVTNKKGKEKAKVSSSPPTNSRNRISLVSRALPVPKTVTTISTSRPAVTHSISAIAATTFFKSAHFQNASPPVPLVSKPKPKAKSFAQAAKANNTAQQTPRFALVSSHENFLHLPQLKEVFPNLLQTTIISMHQASIGSVRACQGSLSCPTVSRILKIVT